MSSPPGDTGGAIPEKSASALATDPACGGNGWLSTTVLSGFHKLSRYRTVRYLGAAVNFLQLMFAIVLVLAVVCVEQISIHSKELWKRVTNPNAATKERSPRLVASQQQHIFNHPALAESATTIAAKIRNGAYKSEEVVSAFIEQAERANQCMVRHSTLP